MQKIILAITTFLLFNTITFATKRNVLFIGNSYTYTNSMPSMLQSLATAEGDTLTFAQSDPGGYTLENHSTYAPTIALIFSQQWDIVVLQEQSELPAFDTSQVDTQVYPYAHILDSMIKANDSCTQTMFMMTWGHADGDPPNCAVYPPICTYLGMQLRLRQSYLQMAQNNSAIVAPVGAAWEVVRDSFPGLWLYQSDSDHPLVTGSYLQTCVLYASMFHKHTYGCSYTDGLSDSEANILQHFADKVTLDSLTQWQQYGHYPDAGFVYSGSGTTVNFTSLDPITTSHNWSFGDATAVATGASPTHTFAHPGYYAVTHTVSTTCFTETQVDSIRVGTSVGISEIQNSSPGDLRIMQQGNHIVTFSSPNVETYESLDVYYMDGRKLREIYFVNGKATTQLPPALYLYKAYSRKMNAFKTGRFASF